MSWWSTSSEGVQFAVRAVPNARRSQVVGVGDDGHLRVRLAAPAVDGKANDELRRHVAEVFGIRRSAVTIVRGQRSRTKVVRVVGVTAPPPSLLDHSGG